MSFAVGDSPNQVAFLDKEEDQHSLKIATSVLKSAGCVALVALAFFAVFAGGVITIGVFTVGCMGLAGPIIAALEGIQAIVGSIFLGLGTVGMIGLFLKAVEVTMEQCKETHQLIWEN